MMREGPIILAAINARYVHCAYASRYLLANLGAHRERGRILEFHLKQPVIEIAESILATRPALVGFSVYIWNIEAITRVAQLVRAVSPGTVIVVGGPEISFDYEATELFHLAEYVVRGEGELLFSGLVDQLVAGRKPESKVLEGPVPELSELVPPYDLYSDHDLKNRMVYIESSRGCPFGCEFCLSSLTRRVRELPLDLFFDQAASLLDRGLLHFTFVDRTFNLREDRVQPILQFFLDRYRENLKLHFEISPDRLSPAMLELMGRFPIHCLNLEVGIQSFHPETLENIQRRQDLPKTLQNIRYLLEHGPALVHADLLVGLPGESLESLALGFDRLVGCGPQQIQIGILKRLKGTPIDRHVGPRRMVFAPFPPYEILSTDLLDFPTLMRLKRFARYWDLLYNSGDFPTSLAFLWGRGESPFRVFLAFSDIIFEKTGRTHEIGLGTLFHLLFDFALSEGADRGDLARALQADYFRLPGRKDKLEFLKGAS